MKKLGKKIMIIRYSWAIILFCLSLKGSELCNEQITCSWDTGKEWLANERVDQRPIVTVWVHGTKLPPQSILYFFLYRKLGLHRAVCYDWVYRLRSIAQELSQADPEHYPLKHIYFFGWSGNLNFIAREKAARDLHASIVSLRTHYKNHYGKDPILRVITHSHGGNVVLNMANLEHTFKVDELIMLACPVQDETSYLVTSPLFKQVYAFYSTGDMIQVADPQGLYKKNKYGTRNFFSCRRFPFELPNLVQAQARNRNATFAHIDFLRTPFVSRLPLIVKEYETIRGECGEQDNWFSVQKIKQKCPRRYWDYGLIFSHTNDQTNEK